MITLIAAHREELEKSAISPKFMEAFSSVGGKCAVELILPEKAYGHAQIYSDYARKYGHLWAGGWIEKGINPLTGEEADYTRLKPDKPRCNWKGKPIKYEVPPGEPTHPFFPRGIDWLKVLANPETEGYIVEGGKKAAAICSQGKIGISIPGIWNFRVEGASGNKELHPWLKAIAKGRKITICFDRDSKPETHQQVGKAAAKLAGLLKKAGALKVSFCHWHESLGKGIDDVLRAFPQAGRDILNSPGTWVQAWKKSFFTADLETFDRFVDYSKIPLEANLIGIKSPWGTGKSYGLAKMIAELKGQNIDETFRHYGQGFLYICHRDQLVRQACGTLGIAYRKDFNRTSYGIGFCIDSLRPSSKMKVNPIHYYGWDIILDEFHQTLEHLLLSPTMDKKERIEVLETFVEVIRQCIAGGGKIWVLDADLQDSDLAFIRGISGCDLNQFKLYNNTNPEEKISLYLAEAREDVVGLFDETIKNGENIFIFTGSQKVKSKWGTKNLAARAKRLAPAATILRVDKDTTADPGSIAYQFKKNPNKLLQELKDEGKQIVLIASPVLETGISIEVDCFSKVLGIASGVQSVESFCQSINRYRLNAPRYCYINKFGTTKYAGNEFNSKEVYSNLRRTGKYLNYILYCEEDEIPEVLDSVPLKYYCNIVGRHNAANYYYKENILDTLANKYNALPWENGCDRREVGESQENIKETETLLEKRKVLNAALLWKSDYELLEKKDTCTEDERIQKIKYLVNEEWGEATPDSINAFFDNKYTSMYNEAITNTKNMSELIEADRAKAVEFIGKRYLPDFVKLAFSIKVIVFRHLGIAEWIRSHQGKDISAKDIEELMDKYSTVPSEAGFRLPTKYAASFIRALLELFGGYELIQVARNAKQRLYRILDPHPKLREKMNTRLAMTNL